MGPPLPKLSPTPQVLSHSFRSRSLSAQPPYKNTTKGNRQLRLVCSPPQSFSFPRPSLSLAPPVNIFARVALSPRKLQKELGMGDREQQRTFHVLDREFSMLLGLETLKNDCGGARGMGSGGWQWRCWRVGAKRGEFGAAFAALRQCVKRKLLSLLHSFLLLWLLWSWEFRLCQCVCTGGEPRFTVAAKIIGHLSLSQTFYQIKKVSFGNITAIFQKL